MTRIRDIMTRSVEVIQLDDTLQHAAQRMRALDVGSLPVCDGPALAGMVTDRDITVRGVADGMLPQEPKVSEVMTEDVQLVRPERHRRAGARSDGRASGAPADRARRRPPDGRHRRARRPRHAASGHTDEALRDISEPD